MDGNLSREAIDAARRLKIRRAWTLADAVILAARIALAATVIIMIGLMLIYYWTEPANLVRMNRPWSPLR